MNVVRVHLNPHTLLYLKNLNYIFANHPLPIKFILIQKTAELIFISVGESVFLTILTNRPQLEPAEQSNPQEKLIKHVESPAL